MKQKRTVQLFFSSMGFWFKDSSFKFQVIGYKIYLTAHGDLYVEQKTIIDSVFIGNNCLKSPDSIKKFNVQNNNLCKITLNNHILLQLIRKNI